jgi:U3 small nucleolar RNA-associated protein 3
MGKRRRAARPEGPSGPREVDPSEARLKIKTFEDVADSEDEYYIEKDRIDFDDEPRSKKLRRQQKEDEFMEPSDEEIFEEDDDSDASDDEEAAPAPKSKKTSTKRGKGAELSDDEEERGEEEEDSGWWGSSRKEYYDADQIETEADALEEEAEARRLQKKKLAKLSEADFMFDEAEWAGQAKGGDSGEVVTEVLKDVQISDDMTAEDKYKLLRARHPELDLLLDEFETLQPQVEPLRKEAEGKQSKSIETVKYWILGSYVASLASYFAILTSPARDESGAQKTLDPSELREHDIMETLMECRETWRRVKDLQPSKSAVSTNGMLSPPEEEDISMDEADTPAVTKKKAAEAKQAAKDAKAKEKKAAKKAKAAKAIEESLADLGDLLKKPKKVKAALEAVSDDEDLPDNMSDFGEEGTLDARTAADKAQRKKSLKFYTSQIVQKASRRADAGRDAGGDADLPYRERFRDRQARLNAEAENRGKKKGGKDDTALGDDSGDEDNETAAKVRDDADEYYDLVAQKSKQRNSDKKARYEAIAAAQRGERIVEQTVVGEDGKRKISYQIDKNKGLAPRRKKEVRNPRVKKRMQYDAKQKKLKSMKPTYKGGEGKGGYKGELSGIKTGLVKSIKL